MAGSSVDGRAAGGGEGFSQMALRGRAGLSQISKTQMQVIENIGDIAIRRNRRRQLTRRLFQWRFRNGSRHLVSRGLLHREFRDRLRFPFVEQLEVFLLKSPVDASLLVADHYTDQYQVRSGSEGRLRIVRGYFGCLSGAKHRAPEHEQTSEVCTYCHQPLGTG